MRLILNLSLLVTMGLALGCQKEEAATPASATATPPRVTAAEAPMTAAVNVIARMHFSGTTQLLADTNRAAKLNEIAALPETAALEEQILQKLATAPCRFLQKHHRIPAGTKDFSGLLRPLLEDLLHNESYVEVSDGTNPVPDLMVAVRLNGDRAELWRTNLATILASWTQLPVSDIQNNGYSGWEVKKHHDPNVIHFIRAGEWVLFGWGQDKILPEADMVQRIKTLGRPVDAMSDYWLETEVDWARLLAHQTVPAPEKLPKMQLSLNLKDDDVRTMAVMEFPGPLKLEYSDWNIPTNLVHDPLISFTAVRGLSPWLRQLQVVKDLQLDSVPDQYYAWAMYHSIFESYIAMPVPDAANFLARNERQIIATGNTNLQRLTHGVSQLQWNDAHGFIQMSGVPPVIMPRLEAVAPTNGNFLLARTFPVVREPKPAPAGLFEQITGQTNLLYYHWEITGERTPQARNFSLLYFITAGEPVSQPNVPAQKWLEALMGKVYNNTTEITQTGPDKLTLLRKSALGLTAFEIALLARWVDAPGFPLDAKYEWPVAVEPPKKTNAPPRNPRPAMAPRPGVPPPAASRPVVVPPRALAPAPVKPQ